MIQYSEYFYPHLRNGPIIYVLNLSQGAPTGILPNGALVVFDDNVLAPQTSHLEVHTLISSPISISLFFLFPKCPDSNESCTVSRTSDFILSGGRNCRHRDFPVSYFFLNCLKMGPFCTTIKPIFGRQCIVPYSIPCSHVLFLFGSCVFLQYSLAYDYFRFSFLFSLDSFQSLIHIHLCI